MNTAKKLHDAVHGKSLIQVGNGVIGGQAIGGGVRYHLPIGPLRIDAAYNPGERCAATES